MKKNNILVAVNVTIALVMMWFFTVDFAVYCAEVHNETSISQVMTNIAFGAVFGTVAIGVVGTIGYFVKRMFTKG